MKKIITNIMLVLMASLILFSCKKDSSKNYADSIAAKTWWGKFAYTGKSSQYYSIAFSASGTFTWSERSGDYLGHWAVEGNHLTITFDASGRKIKSDISEDGKLLNIENNPAYGYTITSGELISNPNTSPLDNTLWKGTYTLENAQTVIVNLRFLPGSKFQFESAGSTPYPFVYTRSASSVIIRGGNNFFGIVISGTEMKGSDSAILLNIWEVKKEM